MKKLPYTKTVLQTNASSIQMPRTAAFHS